MKYIQEDTIVALSTPMGSGAIAIVRLSGPKSLSIVNQLLDKPISSHQVRKASFRQLYSFQEKEFIDQVVVTYFQKPASYTGEDVVEIHCHCNPLIVERVIRECIGLGARIAEPGEFTFRAFVNNKMDLTQAEAVAEVIRARTQESLQQSLRHLEGKLSQRLNALKQHLIDVLASLEISLDFAEEDIELVPRNDLITRIAATRKEVQHLIESYAYGRLLEEGITLLILGKPNVGKSSLLNLLLGKERAIVSEIPGTTRDYIEASFQIDGIAVRAVDTAGIRATHDAIEEIGIQRAIEQLRAADVVLAMFEAHQPLNEDDHRLIEMIRDERETRVFILVLNKIDLGICKSTEEFFQAMDLPVVKVSVIQEEGVDRLKQVVKAALVKDAALESEEVVVTSARHREVLEAVAAALNDAENSLRQGASEEVVALDVRVALDRLGEITGETTPEDILNHIFANFCIGK